VSSRSSFRQPYNACARTRVDDAGKVFPWSRAWVQQSMHVRLRPPSLSASTHAGAFLPGLQPPFALRCVPPGRDWFPSGRARVSNQQLCSDEPQKRHPGVADFFEKASVHFARLHAFRLATRQSNDPRREASMISGAAFVVGRHRIKIPSFGKFAVLQFQGFDSTQCRFVPWHRFQGDGGILSSNCPSAQTSQIVLCGVCSCAQFHKPL
jgi:hypothetical protein